LKGVERNKKRREKRKKKGVYHSLKKKDASGKGTRMRPSIGDFIPEQGRYCPVFSVAKGELPHGKKEYLRDRGKRTPGRSRTTRMIAHPKKANGLHEGKKKKKSIRRLGKNKKIPKGFARSEEGKDLSRRQRASVVLEKKKDVRVRAKKKQNARE